jgi:soluble lytic murein transglycosylase-like protein
MPFIGLIGGSAPRRIRLSQAAAGIALTSALAACSGAPSAPPATVAVAPQPASPAVAASYDPPGPPGDPWGPYIKEASTRFSVPEKWIREVMRQESGGKQYIGGALTTSSVGAMGLMQLMPVTYAQMRDRYGLGADPYAPHDNIMAGTAYIGEMYARYGSPGFLAAYNAGPGRLDSYLVGGTPLPHETVGYLASIAPRLGDATLPTGPLAHYARVETADDLNARSLNGTLPAPRPAAPAVQLASYQVPAPAPASSGESRSGDLIRELAQRNTRSAIDSSPLAAYAPEPPRPAAKPAAAPQRQASGHVVLASAPAAGAWTVQVGAFSSAAQAEAAASAAKGRAHGTLDHARSSVATVSRPHASPVYRAQLVGLSADSASAACDKLGREHVACLVVSPHTGSF